MAKELAIELAIFVPLVVESADRYKNLPVGPGDGETQVRDHSQLDVGIRFPLFVMASVGHEQRFAGAHHRLAIETSIETGDLVRVVRIPFGLAGYEDLDVRCL